MTSPVNGSGEPGGSVVESPISMSDREVMNVKTYNTDSERITYLENRVAILEAEISRFQNALIGAGKFIFENPMSKMMLASLPKDAQVRLKEFFEAKK